MLLKAINGGKIFNFSVPNSLATNTDFCYIFGCYPIFMCLLQIILNAGQIWAFWVNNIYGKNHNVIELTVSVPFTPNVFA